MKNCNKGFTLIELMVAMAMTSIVVAVIYSAYDVQTRIYTEQDRTAEMQQNLRGALAYIQREARMAGYNPNNEKDVTCDAPTGAPKKVAPGIHTATATSFGFSMDLDEDNKCDGANENVTYSINASNELERNARPLPGAAFATAPIAENMTNIDFVYLFPPPKLGAPIKDAPTQAPAATKRDDIVSVQISLLARSKQANLKAATTSSYPIAMPDPYGKSTAVLTTTWGPFTDSYKRQVLTASVNCRNMGL